MAKHFRENTLERYEKKVLLWHGAKIYSLYTKVEKTEAEAEGAKLEDLKIYYYNHMSSDDSEQDWLTVWASLKLLRSV